MMTVTDDDRNLKAFSRSKVCSLITFPPPLPHTPYGGGYASSQKFALHESPCCGARRTAPPRRECG